MRDLDTQEDAYRDFARLVHGIESNKKYLLEFASKVENPGEHGQNIEMVIKAQEGLLREMMQRNAAGLKSHSAALP
jgi:hypothetical protein